MNNSTNSSRADPTFYLTTQLATGIVLTILSPVTVISNALLLFTIFKDPLKCFRTPPTYFIVALAFVDLITGIFIEPFFIMARLVRYITWTIRLVNEPYKSLWFFGGMFSYVGLNASFLLVLGLIVSQFIAITYPHRYRVIVTTRRVLACVILSCVYFTGFILLQYVGIPLSTLYKVDLHLHSTLITVLLISSSLLLLISFHKFEETSRRITTQNSETRYARGGHESKNPRNRISQRQFTIVTLILSEILIVCSLPHIVLVHLRFYMKQETLQERLDLFAFVIIGDEMMFVKVALDAFIYAWRLAKYRRSLKILLGCNANQVSPDATEIRTMDNFTFQQPKSKSTPTTLVQTQVDPSIKTQVN